jgi:hypothetical protein
VQPHRLIGLTQAVLGDALVAAGPIDGLLHLV